MKEPHFIQSSCDDYNKCNFKCDCEKPERNHGVLTKRVFRRIGDQRHVELDFRRVFFGLMCVIFIAILMNSFYRVIGNDGHEILPGASKVMVGVKVNVSVFDLFVKPSFVAGRVESLEISLKEFCLWLTGRVARKEKGGYRDLDFYDDKSDRKTTDKYSV